MADYFRFFCPQCGQRLKAKTDAVGRQAHCKRCGAQFDVPDPSTLKHDPPTPRTPEAALAAAETDPAPMVLKDQTSDNYHPAPPSPRPPAFATSRKGCGRALGIAGLTVVVGCATIGVAAYGIGNKGPGANTRAADTTAFPSKRSSDISQKKPSVSMLVAPPRPQTLGKSKRSPTAPTGGRTHRSAPGVTLGLAGRKSRGPAGRK